MPCLRGAHTGLAGILAHHAAFQSVGSSVVTTFLHPMALIPVLIQHWPGASRISHCVRVHQNVRTYI